MDGIGRADDDLAPAEAFALVGEEIRAEVLRIVFEADPPVRFSTIRERLDVRDPGRVNYHLDRLRGQFLSRSEAGYRLTRRGRAVVRVLLSGRVTDLGDGELLDLGPCVRCGGSLQLRYREQFGAVACSECDRWFVRWILAPGGVEGRSPDGVADLLDTRCRSIRRLADDGVCPLCSGSIDRRLVAGSAFDHARELAYDCDRCGCAFDSTVGAALLERPPVVAFLHDAGIDPRGRPLWRFGFAFDPAHLSVPDDRPGARLALPAGDRRLVVRVGPDGSIHERRRPSGSG